MTTYVYSIYTNNRAYLKLKLNLVHHFSVKLALLKIYCILKFLGKEYCLTHSIIG